ncbi:hypothetical protein [Sinomonas sp.]|uniref:hypothetical protein n=1 Tax=Sinomonas sp. TaxID=1914986 RepID=UPI003F7D9EAA
MSRPLELILWRRTTCTEAIPGARKCDGECPYWINDVTGEYHERDYGYADHNTGRTDYNPAKRLTDSELAAEVWCQETEFRAAVIRGDYPDLDRLATTARFATHPHYDEIED